VEGAERFCHDLAGLQPRVQGRERVLENDLHVLAPLPARTPAKCGEVLAVEDDPSVGRLDQPGDHPGRRRLPAPGLSDERESTAGFDAEADIVDSLDRTGVATQNSGVGRKMLCQVFGHQQRSG
jgi:hypothetical protein